MSRILLVDGDADVRLLEQLRLGGHEAVLATSGATGLQEARSWQPDLVILDIILPDMDGYVVLRMLRVARPDLPVILLTSSVEESDRVLGFRLGADDYVTKPFSVLELLARVDVWLRRTASVHGRADLREVERFGEIEVYPAQRVVRRRGEEVQLSPKAHDLLLALLKRDGAVATRAQLLQEVWGHKGPIVTRTVDIHVAELRRKLEDNSAEPRHIVTVRKSGYRLIR